MIDVNKMEKKKPTQQELCVVIPIFLEIRIGT